MIRRRVLAVVAIVLLAGIQLIGSRFTDRFGVYPDTLLCAALFLSVRVAPTAGLAGAWGIGLLKGLGSAMPLGLDAFLFTLAAAAGLAVRDKMFDRHPVSQFLLTLPLAFGINMGYALALAADGASLTVAGCAGRCLFSAVSTALVAPLIFALLSKLLPSRSTELRIRVPAEG